VLLPIREDNLSSVQRAEKRGNVFGEERLSVRSLGSILTSHEVTNYSLRRELRFSKELA
jgi:hypothetical protein